MNNMLLMTVLHCRHNLQRLVNEWRINTIQGKAGQMEALKSANFERKSAALAKWDSNPESPVFTDVALLTNAGQYIIQTVICNAKQVNSNSA